MSVLLDEVVAALSPLDGLRVVDGTFGAGGYSQALLEAGAEVVAIDRDPSVRPHVERLAEAHAARFSFVEGRFAELDTLVDEPSRVDAVVLDIGVSSMQLDDAARGFSFMRDGPLDMRMGNTGPSAADLVNELDAEPLANILFAFGEERRSRRIAQFILAERERARIETTGRLAGIVEKAIGRKPGDNHPATRSFQALRIAVNREFDELVEGLFAAERLLKQGGRLAVVTFHSLEDRIVKRFLDSSKTAGQQSRHLPQAEPVASRWEDVAKPQKPGREELQMNPRARSATLRTAVRTGVEARAVDYAGLGVPVARGLT
ncbi:16S rRNA (cytosine(1402)-N(4))-methyltransferase RsmH [Devosia pacifica]|nr:16S rRNA (cytosine(1402)-N(4))-methyltransferase RsmH [Devosia pacifica]